LTLLSTPKELNAVVNFCASTPWETTQSVMLLASINFRPLPCMALNTVLSSLARSPVASSV